MFNNDKIVVSDILSVTHVQGTKKIGERTNYNGYLPRYELIYKIS